MTPEILAGLRALQPELWLLGALLAALTLDLFVGRRGAGGRTAVGLVALAGALGGLWALLTAGDDLPGRAFGLLVLDGHARFFRILILSGTAFVVLHAMVFRELDDGTRNELHPMILAAAFGGCLLVSTDHLLMLLLGMEMLSMPSYLLAGWRKRDRRSSEAALKYLVYGGAASALMVFGFSLFFGLSGSLWLSDTAIALVQTWEFGGEYERLAIVFASVLVLVGIGFKIAAFPFHFWAPDVYEGSPTPVTTLLAVVSKAAGFGILVRFVDGVFMGEHAVSGDWLRQVSWILAVLAAVTMTYGNITAVLQRNVKRLLAYSSISHAGYLLMGVAVMTHSADPESPLHGLGIQALLFYLATYYLGTLGAFACAMALASRFGAEDTDDYRGLGWSAPWIGVAFVIFLASLTGLPLTAGFLGKLMLLQAAMTTDLAWLAVVAVLNSVVALFYYFKIARALFLRGDTAFVPGIAPRGFLPALAAASVLLLAGVTVWYGLPGVDDLITWVSAHVL
ncbi:MAG: NADH-quinone oxidoreductase subunit N [Planctomycetota bacterium]